MFPRTSSRLKAAGYYEGDEMTPAISYRESPVRVFKRRRGQRRIDQSDRWSTASDTSAIWGNSWADSSDCCWSDSGMTSSHTPVWSNTSMTGSSSSAWTIFSSAVKKTTACLLVFFILSFGFWFLNAGLTSYFVKTISHLDTPVTAVPPPATTMQDFKLKENHISEVVASLENHFRSLDQSMKNLDWMQQQLASLSLEADRLRAESLSASELLHKRIAAQEVYVTKMNEQLLSIKQQIDTPPRVPDQKHKLGCHRPLADNMADFAIELQGARVMEHLTSETYRTRPPMLNIFGVPFYWGTVENPRTVIQGHADALPGRCWAFAGGRGHIAISLSNPVTISHVTLDHIKRSQSPYGHIDSAPRKFSVYGMRSADDTTGTWLGSFEYDQDGGSTQTFQLPDAAQGVYKSVKLVVESNWGHPDYTCLYRFRVHGEAR